MPWTYKGADPDKFGQTQTCAPGAYVHHDVWGFCTFVEECPLAEGETEPATVSLARENREVEEAQPMLVCVRAPPAGQGPLPQPLGGKDRARKPSERAAAAAADSVPAPGMPRAAKKAAPAAGVVPLPPPPSTLSGGASRSIYTASMQTGDSTLTDSSMQPLAWLLMLPPRACRGSGFAASGSQATEAGRQAHAIFSCCGGC